MAEARGRFGRPWGMVGGEAGWFHRALSSVVPSTPSPSVFSWHVCVLTAPA